MTEKQELEKLEQDYFIFSTKKYEDNNDVKLHFGTVLCSDEFYSDTEEKVRKNLVDYGVLGAEMESAALFMAAQKAGKKSLAVFTVSDKPGEESTSEEREVGYTEMMKLALEIAPE